MPSPGEFFHSFKRIRGMSSRRIVSRDQEGIPPGDPLPRKARRPPLKQGSCEKFDGRDALRRVRDDTPNTGAGHRVPTGSCLHTQPEFFHSSRGDKRELQASLRDAAQASSLNGRTGEASPKKAERNPIQLGDALSGLILPCTATLT